MDYRCGPMTRETNVSIRWRFLSTLNHTTRTRTNYSIHAVDYIGKFRELVRRWRLETVAGSSVMEMVENENFQQIIQMGEKAVPLIVSELKIQRDFLFMALTLILPHELVVPDAAKGKPLEMIDAWLSWADERAVKR